MLDLENTHEQNVRERVERDGVAAEMLRQMYVDRLKSHNEGFYEHGSTVDIIGICQAFDLLKQEGCEAVCRAHEPLSKAGVTITTESAHTAHSVTKLQMNLPRLSRGNNRNHL